MPSAVPPAESPNPQPRSWGPGLVVLGVWALLLGAHLAFVARFGVNLPLWDDWSEVVPVLLGEQPITLTYLWSQHNEHRILVPRLLQPALTRLAGDDFRAGMFFNVVLSGVLALALILVARRLRGRLSCADAFFPLVLLHWGHHGNTLRGDTTGNVLATALACAVLGVIVCHRRALSLRVGVAVGLCLLLLPLCGANGLAFVPALALWLGHAGASRWRSAEPGGKQAGLVLLTLAVAALLLCGLYFLDYHHPGHHAPSPGPRSSLRTGLEFLAAGWGRPAEWLWPFSGALTLGLLLASAGLLIVRGRQQPGERSRVLGLLLFFGAIGSLAVAVGQGRASFGPFMGFSARYMLLATPVLCGVYFAWELYGPGATRRWAPMGLAVLALLLLWPNAEEGLHLARAQHKQARAFTREMRNGVPPDALARRYAHFLHPDPALLAVQLQQLMDAGIGPFRLQESPRSSASSTRSRTAVIGSSESAGAGPSPISTGRSSASPADNP